MRWYFHCPSYLNVVFIVTADQWEAAPTQVILWLVSFVLCWWSVNLQHNIWTLSNVKILFQINLQKTWKLKRIEVEEYNITESWTLDLRGSSQFVLWESLCVTFTMEFYRRKCKYKCCFKTRASSLQWHFSLLQHKRQICLWRGRGEIHLHHSSCLLPMRCQLSLRLHHELHLPHAREGHHQELILRPLLPDLPPGHGHLKQSAVLGQLSHTSDWQVV